MRDRRWRDVGRAGAGDGRCLRSGSGCVPGDRMPVWGAGGWPPEHSISAAFFCPALGPQVIMTGLYLLAWAADTECRL